MGHGFNAIGPVHAGPRARYQAQPIWHRRRIAFDHSSAFARIPSRRGGSALAMLGGFQLAGAGKAICVDAWRINACCALDDLPGARRHVVPAPTDRPELRATEPRRDIPAVQVLPPGGRNCGCVIGVAL